jgi:hypothetical protein
VHACCKISGGCLVPVVIAVQIQNIMIDPVMQQVLKECQETPGSLSKHLRNPSIASKLQKLMGAGIIRMS